MIPVFYLHFINEWLKLNISDRIINAFYASSLVLQILNVIPGVFFSGVNDVSILSCYPQAGPFYVLYLFYFSAGILYPQWRMFKELKSAYGMRKNQIIYPLIGSVIATLGGPANFLPSYGLNVFPAGTFFLSFYFGLLSFAIIRYRLMDITVVIRKTIIYSSVAGTLTLLYVSMIVLFARLFEGISGYNTLFSSGAAAVLVAVGFQPLRKRLQDVIDRKFFRQYVDREEKLYELSREIITHTTPEALAGALMRVLGDTFHPKSAGLYLKGRYTSSFTRMGAIGEETLPESMTSENALAAYFADHSQPFVLDAANQEAMPRSTRTQGSGERSSADSGEAAA